VYWLLAVLTCCASVVLAQRTVVENNGVGGRIETDYNADGKIVQMRTVGSDGKVQQKVDYEYVPGYYTAQQTDITYWPNGQIRRVAHTTYDESANFTGEAIQVFDESGQQTAGHKLVHNPWTGTYRCSEWSAASHEFRTVECPEGEEDRGEPKAQTFTYTEVMHNLDAARKTARQEKKLEHILPATSGSPVRPPVTTTVREVGLVLPAQLHPGERVSGSLVEDSDQYAETPEVTVTRVAIPFESTGEASRLAGWWFESSGEKSQRADEPVTLVVPARGSALNITFRQVGNPGHSISRTLTLSLQPQKPASSKVFHAPALCLKGGLCIVRAPLSGDSSRTFAAFENRPAPIVAETSDRAFISIPEQTAPGARPLLIAEGTKVVAFPVVVGELTLKNNHRELAAGQTLIMFPTLDGPSDIPDRTWEVDGFTTAVLAQARRLIPEFQPKENLDEEAQQDTAQNGELKNKERQERKKGEIILVIKNDTPEQISLRSSTNEMLIFHLSNEAFRRGAFKYDLIVQAKQPGKVAVKGYVIPFLAPVAGQEFLVKAATSDPYH
jgi:hypothetical protein